MKCTLSSLLTVALLFTPHLASADSPDDDAKPPMKQLIANLSAENGQERAAATKALFGKGVEAINALKAAGAEQISPHGTISTRRIDMVYSLLAGLQPNPVGGLAGYKTDSFGLHFEPGVTEADAQRMGREYGFAITGKFTPEGRPTCYVRLQKRIPLADVLKSLLSNEPSVVSINLNYFET